jgi:hypothetical protein
MSEPDPRVVRLVKELDQERTRRIKAERLATSLQARFAWLKAQRVAADAKEPEHRPT